MKKNFPAIALAFSALAFAACNDTKTSESTTDTSTVSQVTTDTMGASKTSNEFVTVTAQNGMAEVEMGKQAQSNGGSQDVKDFGKTLETDHGNANAALTAVANEENIQLPTAMTDDHQKHLSEMGAMKGKDYDKHFIDMMIDSHGKSIERFKDAAANNANAKVKDFAAKTLPTLEAHLAKAKAIKSKMK
jgi:putative membrane protein